MSTEKTMRTIKTTSACQVDRMFWVYADRTRLLILHILQAGELCVSDLITVLKVPQGSHHLNYPSHSARRYAQAGALVFLRAASGADAFPSRTTRLPRQCLADVSGLAADRRRAAEVKASGRCRPRECWRGKPRGPDRSPWGSWRSCESRKRPIRALWPAIWREWQLRQWMPQALVLT